jgi:hypothetical protein
MLSDPQFIDAQGSGVLAAAASAVDGPVARLGQD